MLYAIISDVHANLEAVTVCLKEIDKIKPERLICLGDLVDYCAEPNEIVEIIRERCDVVIIGNHDEAQFNYPMVEGYREHARISSIHTRRVIKPEHIDYFKSLQYTHSEHDLFFTHASPYTPELYRYVLDIETARKNFESFKEKICFIGHSHRPVVFRKFGNNVSIVDTGRLNPDAKYIINIGSVGQPRDGNPKLSFGVFDTDKFEFKLIRLDYDIKSAADKILKEPLPAFLSERLYAGI